MPTPSKDELRVRLTNQTLVVNTAMGPQAYPREPSTASQWTQYSGLYQEFKVHGMKVTVAGLGETSAAASTSLIALYDNSLTSSTPPSASSCFGYGSSKVFNTVHVTEFHLPKLPEMLVTPAGGGSTPLATEWIATSLPATLRGIAVLSPLVTIAGTVPVLIEWDVTFKGRNE